MQRICVFTGSYPGAGEDYLAAVRELAEELVSRNWAWSTADQSWGSWGRWRVRFWTSVVT